VRLLLGFFLVWQSFICGKLLVGKVSSFGEGLFYRTALTGPWTGCQWGLFIGIGFALVNP
jgi:hypothetical protein